MRCVWSVVCCMVCVVCWLLFDVWRLVCVVCRLFVGVPVLLLAGLFDCSVACLLVCCALVWLCAVRCVLFVV